MVQECSNVKPSFDDLTLKIVRNVGDVEPAKVLLGDELGEANLAFALHLLYELEEPAVIGPIAGNEICSTSDEVMTMLGTANELVELLAAVARAHHDGLAPRLTDRI